ncbi:MAG: GGDEF domain-containing protein [Firmicutes bacterium]|nr:GGDEF domain-containing protein [Bacillota bacterium]
MIEILVDYDINLFAIVLLLVLYTVIRVKRDIYRYSTHLLSAIIWITILALIVEPITWIFDSSQDSFELAINYISNYTLVMLSPILIGIWGSYLDYKIFGNRKRIIKRHYYQFLSYIMFVFLIINIFYPIFFYIDDNFSYHVANLEWIKYVIIYGGLLYLLGFVFINRKIIKNNIIYGVIAFFFLPLVGSVLQIIDYHLFFSWTMLALSAVVVYIFLETTTGIRDYLTRLYSRRTMEEYVSNLYDRNYHFTLIMMDLNHFKAINDQFGHHVGDQVLIAFAKLLRDVFKEEKMIARYGGDEFIVVIELLNNSSINEVLNEMRLKIKNDPFFNTNGLFDFSSGMSVYNGHESLDQLYIDADKRMYKDKSFINNNK